MGPAFNNSPIKSSILLLEALLNFIRLYQHPPKVTFLIPAKILKTIILKHLPLFEHKDPKKNNEKIEKIKIF